MFSLNATGAADLVLAFGYALGVFLIVRSLGKGLSGSRVAGVVAVPALAGLVIILALLPTQWGDSLRVFRLSISGLSRPFSAAAILVAVIAAIAAGDLVLDRIARIAHALIASAGRLVSRGTAPGGWSLDVALLLVCGVTAAVTVALATVLRPESRLQVLTPGEEINFILEATYSLPGLPQGMAFRGEKDGYISFAEQGIMRFVLPSQPDGVLQLELVAPDSGDIRGLAILKDTLFVAHNASVQRGDISQDTNAGDEGLLSPKGGSIIAFDILPNGQLQNRRTVVPDLPVANGWHSVNAVAAGPDGMLYVTIGGSRNSAAYADNPMLGTVLRFNPDGSGLEVVARGIRNIYDLTFDDQGRLFAADNDGPTDRGFKREEVLAIRKGDHYGYPVEGTSDIPHRVRTAPPLWVLSNTDSGSAGTEWAGEVGVADGLFIGGPHLKYLPILEDDRGYFVPASRDTEPGRILLDRQGFMTIVEAGPGRRLYVGVYGFTRTSDLYVLKFQ